MRALLAIALLLLSGCFGLPDGAADFGDEITISYVAVDPETGHPLISTLNDVPNGGAENTYLGSSLEANVRSNLGTVPAELSAFFVREPSGFIPPVSKADFHSALVAGGWVDAFSVSKTFVLGSGTSGLGFEAERGMIGMQVNGTRIIESHDDSSRGFNDEVLRSKWLGPAEPLDTEIERGAFEQNLGTPSNGQVFPYNNLFQAEVVSFDNSTVNARLLIDETTSFDASIVGGTVFARIQGDSYRFELVLTPGEEFTLVSTPFQPAPLELADGSYKSVGTRGDDVVWSFTSTPRAIAGVPVDFHVELTAHQVGSVAADPENYGARQSPVLPHTHASQGHSHEPAPEAGDDGHDHTH